MNSSPGITGRWYEPCAISGVRLPWSAGALVFSYGIGEDWLKLRDRGMTADWQVYPTTQWNYALALDAAASSHDVSAMDTEVSDRPFSAKGAPVKLHVKGRKLPAWQGVWTRRNRYYP